MYRQSTPREVLGNDAARNRKIFEGDALPDRGRSGGRRAAIDGGIFGAGIRRAGRAKISSHRGDGVESYADPLGGIELQASSVPSLRELGLESALGVMLTDKETQAPSGACWSATRTGGNGSRTRVFFCRPSAISW